MYLIRFLDGGFFVAVNFHGFQTTQEPYEGKKFTRGEAYALIAKLRLRAEVIDYERFIPARPEAKAVGNLPPVDIRALLPNGSGVGASDVPVPAHEERVQPSGTSAGEHVDPK